MVQPEYSGFCDPMSHQANWKPAQPGFKLTGADCGWSVMHGAFELLDQLGKISVVVDILSSNTGLKSLEVVTVDFGSSHKTNKDRLASPRESVL